MVDDTVYDYMGGVAAPATNREPDPNRGPGIVEKAFDRLYKAGATVGRPMQELAQRYTENTQEAAREAANLAVESSRKSGQAMREGRPLDATGQAIWQTIGNIGIPFAPLTGAAKTAGDYATKFTGDPTFGAKVALAGEFVDPSKVGMAKSALLAKAASTAQDVLPYMAAVAPAGNLNLRPSFSSEMLRGPDAQRADAFLAQFKNAPGVSEEAYNKVQRALSIHREGDLKYPMMTKQEFESYLPPSRFNKVDLKGTMHEDEVHWHYLDEARDFVNDNIDEVYSDAMFDRFGIQPNRSQLTDIGLFQNERMQWEELPENIRSAVELKTPEGTDPAAFLRSYIGDSVESHVDSTYQGLMANIEGFDIGNESYKYRDVQRLVHGTTDEAGKKTFNPESPNYVEKGVTHPDQKESYYHYPFEYEEGGLVGHFRGEFLPEGGSIVSGEKINPDGSTSYNYHETKPNSFVIEEIQSDAQKDAAQKGHLANVHATVFKAAIQEAIEKGANTVYYPTAKTISAVREGKAGDFSPIYDKEIVKHGLKPLEKVEGVTINPVADGAYYEINFDQKAKDHILSGEGQKLSGYAMGGAIDHDDIDRFIKQQFGKKKTRDLPVDEMAKTSDALVSRALSAAKISS